MPRTDGLRHRRRRVDVERSSAGRGGADAVARALARGADRRERLVEHLRQRRHLHRACARRDPDRGSGYTASFAFIAAVRRSGLFVARISSRREDEGTAEPRRRSPKGRARSLRASARSRASLACAPDLLLRRAVLRAPVRSGCSRSTAALSLLHTGNAGVGLLESACGAGAIAGAGLPLVLLARARLATDFGIGFVLWGTPLVFVAAFPHVWVAAVALAVLGAGNSIIDVAAMTLIQRTAPTNVGRTGLRRARERDRRLDGRRGTRHPAARPRSSGSRRPVRDRSRSCRSRRPDDRRRCAAVDRGAAIPAEQIDALRSVSFLAVLPVQALEFLAARMKRVELPDGAILFARGDHGDSFYVLDAGRLAIELPEETKIEEAPGYVGEIALLRDVPRTATVRAASDVVAVGDRPRRVPECRHRPLARRLARRRGCCRGSGPRPPSDQASRRRSSTAAATRAATT